MCFRSFFLFFIAHEALGGLTSLDMRGGPNRSHTPWHRQGAKHSDTSILTVDHPQKTLLWSDQIFFEGRDPFRKSENLSKSWWTPPTVEATGGITFVDDSDQSGNNRRPGYNLSKSTYAIPSFNRRRNSTNTFGQIASSSEWGGAGGESSMENSKFIWKSNSRRNGTTSDWRSDDETMRKRKLLEEDTCGIDLPRRILGGTTADIDEFPWMALLQYRDRNGKISHDCGGALISSRYVLTAAHCTIGLGVTTRKVKLEKVQLGEWDLTTERDCQGEVCSDGLQEIEIEEIVNHPRYNARQTSQTNDIALIRLRRPATINQFVQPICLPPDDFDGNSLEKEKLSVSGWGKTSNAKNSNSNVKMKVEVPGVAWETCRSFYESFYNDVKIEKSQMCAGGEDGKDTCQGDSGGPLMSSGKVHHEFRWFVVGIVSSGPAACGVEGRPSLYTKVPEFTKWILDNIRA